MDVCCPTACDLHVCSDGGTDARSVGREVHVHSDKSDVEDAWRFVRRGRSSPKRLTNALTSDVAKVLDEPEGELIIIEHIQRCATF